MCRQNFPTGQPRSWSQYNNEADCTENGGVEGKRERWREREREREIEREIERDRERERES